MRVAPRKRLLHGERAVAVVPQHAGGALDRRGDHVEIAVRIDVGRPRSRRRARPHRIRQPGRGGDVGERPVPLLPQQRQPMAPGDHEIGLEVVVQSPPRGRLRACAERRSPGAVRSLAAASTRNGHPAARSCRPRLQAAAARPHPATLHPPTAAAGALGAPCTVNANDSSAAAGCGVRVRQHEKAIDRLADLLARRAQGGQPPPVLGQPHQHVLQERDCRPGAAWIRGGGLLHRSQAFLDVSRPGCRSTCQRRG